MMGEKAPVILVGDCDGVAPRAVAGDMEFWRRKGDWRPESLKTIEDGRGADILAI